MKKKVFRDRYGKAYEVEPTLMEYMMAGEKPVIQPYDPNAVIFVDDSGDIRTANPIKEEKPKRGRKPKGDK